MEDIQNSRNIDLFGRVERIIFKDRNLILFSFVDDVYGPLICTARKNECILYYQVDKNERYHLQAQLKGFIKETDSGETFLNNGLYVKRVCTKMKDLA